MDIGDPMSAPDGGVTAVLVQMAELARQFAALDGRENDHYRDVGTALTGLGASVDELRTTVTGHAGALTALDGVGEKLAELEAAIEPLLPPEPGPGYNPAPAVQWWAEDLSDTARAKAVARLRGWVQQIYRPFYGHLAAKLGDCWADHPLCLVQLDWASELWAVLYLRPSRTAGILTSQADFGTRILPAVADQLSTETLDCRKHSRPQAVASGWAGAR
jgi:hypothetical protein